MSQFNSGSVKKMRFELLPPVVRNYPGQLLRMRKLAVLLVLSVIALGQIHPVRANYPASFVDQVQSYPNIKSQRDRCLPRTGNYQYSETYVCDPAQLLTTDQVNQLNELIMKIKSDVNNGQNNCQSSSPKPVIAIALINKMSVETNEPEKLLSYASIFSYYLYDTWALPTNCATESDKLIIFYSKQDGALYTFAGDLLKYQLPTKLIISTAVESRLSFANGVFEGLRFLLDKYRDSMTTSPRLSFNSPMSDN